MKTNILLLIILLALGNVVFAQTSTTINPDGTTADTTINSEEFKIEPIVSPDETEKEPVVTNYEPTQDTLADSDESMLNVPVQTEQPLTEERILLPPKILDVKYKNDTADIQWMATLESYALTNEYVIYRRCGDTSWMALSEVSVNPDSQFVYTAFDKAPIDGCEYAVAARNDLGNRSKLSPPKLLTIPILPMEDLAESGTTGEPIPTDTAKDAPVEITTDTGYAEVVYEKPVIADTLLSTENKVLSEKEKISAALMRKTTFVSGRYIIHAEPRGDTTIKTSNIEIYIKKDNSSYKEYLGKFNFNSVTNKWEFIFDTRKYPNGDYILIPRGVLTTGEIYIGYLRHIHIENKVDVPIVVEDETEKVSLINHTQSVVDDVQKVDESLEQKRAALKAKLIESFKNSNVNVYQDATTNNLQIDKELNQTFDRNVDEMTALSMENNQAALLEKKRQIAERFGITYGESDTGATSSRAIEIQKAKEEVQSQINDMEAVVQERKKLLDNRVQAEVFKDADSDGISNFDEINIYKTDPFVFDSDGDGVGDGAEIENGFNPLNAKLEAVMEYQEARNAGMVNADIFKVKSVRAVIKKDTVPVAVTTRVSTVAGSTSEDTALSKTKMNSGEDMETPPETIIKTTVGLEFEGIAPPNSFVTLYIYSTPIIVTVKTDADGNWSYIFDKELEDGDHEVYVAMTDNMGQVYMKSNPLNFVKVAEAVTYDEPTTTIGEVNQPSYFNQKYVYVTILFIMTIIGAFLVIIGARGKKQTVDIGE